MDSTTGESRPPAGCRWWLKMLLAGATLGVLCLSGCVPRPNSAVSESAARYRGNQDPQGTGLRAVVEWAAAKGASREQIIALLGQPASEGHNRMRYEIRPARREFVANELYLIGYDVVLRDGRAARANACRGGVGVGGGASQP
jgi:hypothetical protein